MGQMVLADDDLGIYTKVAGTTQDFDDAANRCSATPRIAHELDVDDSAIEFRQSRNAPPTDVALFDSAESKFLCEPWRQLMPGRNLHFVLDARVVRQHDISPCPIAKQANEGGMRAVQDSHDAALGPLRARYAAAPLNLHEDVVTVHGVLDRVSSDVHIAIELRDRSVGHHKPVAVGMKDQTARDFISTGQAGLWAVGRGSGASRLLLVVFSVSFTPSQAIAAARHLLDGTALFQFRKHFEQRPRVRLFQAQAFGELLDRSRLASKLQKTQYVIGAEARGARHEVGAFQGGANLPLEIVDTFLASPELFSGFRDYMSRPTHEPASRPPSD